MSQSEMRRRRRAERREARAVINARTKGMPLERKVAYLELVADEVDRSAGVGRAVFPPPPRDAA